MCGRFVLHAARAELMECFGLAECPDLAPSYNICPLSPIIVVRQRPNGERVGHMLQWGLVPSGSKDAEIASKLLMARAETIMEKRSFGAAFQKRRCVIPASGYFEWQDLGASKQPFYFFPVEAPIVCFAGIWERWIDRDGNALDSVALVTTCANSVTVAIHDRMPALLATQGAVDAWLDRASSPEQLLALLGPCPPNLLRCFAVSKDVGNTRNNRPDLIDPIL